MMMQVLPSGTPAHSAKDSASEMQQLCVRGVENFGILTGGYENWQIWSWKGRNAASVMQRLDRRYVGSEALECEGVQTILDDSAEFLEADQAKCTNARRYLYSFLVRQWTRRRDDRSESKGGAGSTPATAEEPWSGCFGCFVSVCTRRLRKYESLEAHEHAAGSWQT